MKFMLMMNAPRGTGDWSVGNWPPDDIKAHIAFMRRFAGELHNSGELAGAEGLFERAGDREAAIARYRAAAERTTSVPQRNYLLTKAARLAADRGE